MDIMAQVAKLVRLAVWETLEKWEVLDPLEYKDLLGCQDYLVLLVHLAKLERRFDIEVLNSKAWLTVDIMTQGNKGLKGRIGEVGPSPDIVGM